MDSHKIQVEMCLALHYFSISTWEGNGQEAVPAGGKGMSQTELGRVSRRG